MQKRSRKKRNINELASDIVGQAIENDNGKNPAAVALGRLGGLKGGKARAKKLTASQRSDIAKKAALKRWHGK